MNLNSKENIKQFLDAHYNLNTKEIIPLENGVQNLNFLILTNKYKFVFRIYNWKNIEDLHYTTQILLTLQNNNFPSPELIPTVNNEWSFHFHNKPCILYRYIPGKKTNKKSRGLIKQIGALQGKMHTLLINENQGSSGLNWDYDDLEKIILKKKPLLKSAFPEIFKTIEFITDELKKISFTDRLPQGGTHQDIKPENVLIDNKRLVKGIIDFDNGYYGDLLHDVTTTICWYCFNDTRISLRCFEDFICSYQEERIISGIEKEYFYQSIKFRLLREAIIWPMYVSHNASVAIMYSDYFLILYKHFDIKESVFLKYI
jgi:Ser/Thr protein kinase RdoA (MazF antagonist)